MFAFLVFLSFCFFGNVFSLHVVSLFCVSDCQVHNYVLYACLIVKLVGVKILNPYLVPVLLFRQDILCVFVFTQFFITPVASVFCWALLSQKLVLCYLLAFSVHKQFRHWGITELCRCCQLQSASDRDYPSSCAISKCCCLLVAVSRWLLFHQLLSVTIFF